MLIAAVWMQETYNYSSRDATLLMIFIGVVAFSLLGQAVIQIYLAAKAAKSIKEFAASAEDIKAKLLPLIDSAKELSLSAHSFVTEATPKVKTITDNLLAASEIVRTSATNINKTVTDANARTQRQVARVDGMVTAALTTTAEIVETVNHGIRVPAQKIAVMANQARFVVEGLLDKVKSFAGVSPFGRPKDPPFLP